MPKYKIFFLSFIFYLFFNGNLVLSDNNTLSTKYGCTGVLKPANESLLNIATFNIGKGNEPTKAVAIANLFEKYDIDILGIQEVYRYGDNYEYTVVDDVPVAFSNKFPGKSFYYYSIRQESDHSIMIVSKFPFNKASEVAILGGRNVIVTSINTPYGLLDFYNTHLQRKDDAQCGGLNEAISFIKNYSSSSTPFLLLGDFNLELSQIQSSCGILPNESFTYSCTSVPCYQSGIDFFLPSLTGGPELIMVCANPDYLMDSHEFYVSTIKMPSNGVVSNPLDYDISGDLKFDLKDIYKLISLIFK